MKKWLRFLLAGILIFGLILVRKFEDILFYDPFLSYFKGDTLNQSFPEYDDFKIILNISFRYLLNSLLTLGIIALIFKDRRKVKFTAIVLLLFLIVLLPVYLYFIHIQFSLGENIGFYIRRFLIQPMLLLILIPAFYYQNYLTSTKEE